MTFSSNCFRPDDKNSAIAPDKLVSVIIPCYNQAQFLGEAIESVLLQSYPHFEVIVIDDGSTDNTLEIAARYSEVRTIRQNQQGISTTRNRGWRESRGRWLVFLDSDDRLLPHALELGVKHLLRHADCAFVFGRHREIDADGTALATTSFVDLQKDPYRQLLLYNCVYTPSTAMFQRDLFETVAGFDPSCLGAEDYDLYLRLARKFPVVSYDNIVAEYRRHDANMTSDNAHMLKVCLAVLRRQKLSVQGNNDWEQAYQTGMNNWRRLWGERLVSQVWSDLKEGREWQRSMRDMMVLMRHGPDVFPRQLGRKLRRSLIADRNGENDGDPQLSGEVSGD
ncbi:MAG: glycosyltransferase [Pyrinomonadaceae bacterium]|nr:glycosyltransferase [Pyrinomonadaceae bacterium]